MFTFVRSGREQRGISLLELMLALVVVGALLLLVTRYYQQTRENMRIAQAIEMINNAVNAGYKWLEGQPNFKAVKVTVLADSQFLPQSYKEGNANPWKGTIDVVSANNSDYMTVILTGIPTKSCQNLKEKMLNRALKINNQPMPDVVQPECKTQGNGPLQTFSMSF
jgi:Tfp pilus assembly protein PilE